MVVGTVGTQDRARRRDLQESAPQDVLVARQPIVGMLQDDAERILGEMLGGSPASAVDVVPPARWAAASVRHYLHVGEGDGYWDFYRPWTALMLSVTDATYRTDTWVRVEGTDYFKLRVLLSGTLRARSGQVIARAPEALLYVSPGATREGYYIGANEPIRMVVLHCRPNLLNRVLGLDLSDVPSPLNSLFLPGRGAAHQRLTPSAEMIHVAGRIVQSRHELSRALRDRHLQTLSIELLLQVLGILENRTLVQSGAGGISARDAARIYEARDYLAQHYANPPNIPQLARMIGLNRTKLKESFRDTVGFTIYEYILQRRMERAAEMLVTGDYGVAQVAYAVGYEYPANFTAAFKRHFGQLPHTWKRRHLGH
ncbi:MAG TPA: AraC family transcriptional regulator [Steroidobacteraceae bacterium]|nr:AraC family transcriptional regulator [Steroidobacteraceae bacterium]